jgi:hypothetical protein
MITSALDMHPGETCPLAETDLARLRFRASRDRAKSRGRPASSPLSRDYSTGMLEGLFPR